MDLFHKKVQGVMDIDTMFFVVVDRGKANAILRKTQECGATGGTIFFGEGTVPSKLLEVMGINEIQKEILMIPSSHELSDQLHQLVNDQFMFSKRNKGIAFSVPFQRWKLHRDSQEQEKSQKDGNSPYCCIMTIVDKGRSKACLKAARAAGAMGGTLIHGRGAGIPTDFYFSLVIEPQKDIVMIISTRENAPSIRERIFSDLELEKTGKGIIFTLPVTRTTGIFENRSDEGKGAMP